MAPQSTDTVQIPAGLKPADGRFGCGPSKVRPEALARLAERAAVMGTSHRQAPVRGVVREIREVAVRTFEAVGCEGLARVDVFVTPDGDVVVNEINTMPGFMPFSMYPRMWQATGLSYPDLIDELLQLALHRPTGLR